MHIFTSRYANPALADDKGVKVGITLGVPRRRLPYNLTEFVRRLAPNSSFFRAERPEFERQYRAKLDKHGVASLAARLQGIATKYSNERLILLCYEDLRQAKPGVFCHRRMLAHWWHEQTGQPIPDLELVADSYAPAVPSVEQPTQLDLMQG